MVLLLPSQFLACGTIGCDADQIATNGPVNQCMDSIEQRVGALKGAHLRSIGTGMERLEAEQFHARVGFHFHIAELRLPRLAIGISTQGVLPFIARHATLQDSAILQHLRGAQGDAPTPLSLHTDADNARCILLHVVKTIVQLTGGQLLVHPDLGAFLLEHQGDIPVRARQHDRP